MSKSVSEERIEELTHDGIDSIVHFDAYQFGGWAVAINRDSCVIEKTEFLIWRKRNQTYFRKITSCSLGGYYQSKITVADSSKVFEFINKNFKNLDTSYIMPAVIKWRENGKEVYQPISSNHPKMFEISIYYSRKAFPIKKSFQEIWMQESFKHNKNLNFEYNQSNPVKILTDLILKETQLLESNGSFMN